MMQEVNEESPVPTTEIVDQLQEAAQTYVTQATSPIGGTASSPSTSSPSLSNAPLSPVSNMTPLSQQSPTSVPPPVELPPNLSSPLGGTTSSVPPPRAPGWVPTASPLQPPPTGGFVRSPGAVTGTPSKYPSSIGMPSADLNPAIPQSTVMSPSMSPSNVTQTGPRPHQYSPYSPQAQTIPATQQYAGYTPQSQVGYSMRSPSSQYATQMSPPPGITSPHETSASIDLGGDPMSMPGAPFSSQQDEGNKQGLFGWFTGSQFMNKVVEKTKTLSENVITTLDPGMKQVIYSSGSLEVVVASEKEVKVGAVRQAFQDVFGRAMVIGHGSQPAGIAPQPVGYTAGLKGCEERIEQMRRSGAVADHQVLVAVENFIVEMLPDRWFDVGCVLLKDPANQIELQSFTQATPVPGEYVQQAQDQTPSSYDLRWSGLAVTVGQTISQNLPHVDHTDWHGQLTGGVSRRDLIYMCAKALAGMYRQRVGVRGEPM